MSSPLKQLATEDDIRGLFKTMLGRDTTDEHLEGFIAHKSTIQDVVDVLLSTVEIIHYLALRHGEHSTLGIPAKARDIRHLFRTMLRRDVSDRHVADLVRSGATLLTVIQIIIDSNELVRLVMSGNEAGMSGLIDGPEYRVPRDLTVSGRLPKRVLMIGSCMLEAWHTMLTAAYPEVRFEFSIFNNASVLPEALPDELAGYDFCIAQIPLRSVLPEASYFQLRYSDVKGYESLFEQACRRLEENLHQIVGYNRSCGLPTFITNFHTIQQNPMGRLQDRYSLNNMTYFMERLNQHLYHCVKALKDVDIIDFDEITATFGKKHVNEDLVFVTSHGAMLVDIDSGFDGHRLEPLGSVAQLYGIHSKKYVQTAFEEACSMHRTIRQVDSVKMVIFDLDDTLWRGVAAELDEVDPDSVEGWPIGLVEAVSYLWRRGILVAIVSKNDIENVRRIWDTLYGSRFSLDKFVSVVANWEPKAANIAAIMTSVNLLPNSVLFVDDNPLERAAVKAAFAEIRVMEAPVASWRRILLWSGETQRAVVTDEAVARTEMVQAQIRREHERAETTHDQFLGSLGVQVTASEITGRQDRKFDRCFELLNKTNQFNTTGTRWSGGEMEELFANGGSLISLEVRDRFTSYGITGLLIVEKDTIRQFVLSCRVFGMGVEQTGIAVAQRHIAGRNFDRVRGHVVPTAKNKLSGSIFQSCGFVEVANGVWELAAGRDVCVPGHIELGGGQVARSGSDAVLAGV